MVCAVYTRQSVRGEGDLTSCDVQREMCLRFAKSRELRVSGKRFDDEGISGATLERPALQRLISLVRSGTIGAVVVHRLDRVSRRVRDCLELLEEFKARGVRLFITAMPELAGGAADTLMLNILSAFVEFERDIIASRIRDSRAGLVARGQRIAGVTPFGYTSDKRTKQFVPFAAEAEVVCEFFRLIAAGLLPREVARLAAERCWKTRAGGAWTARQVLDTIANAAYFGRIRTAKGARTGTQVRAFDIEETARSVLMEPDRAFPRKRGRPTRAAVSLYSLGQVLPLLDPNNERELIQGTVQEVVWNADSQGIRLTLDLTALADGIPQPIGLATSVCRLDPGYRR